MTLIVCLDTKNGLRFNGRRQSRDSVIIDKIYSIVSDSRLLLKGYSKQLFSLPLPNMVICDDPVNSACKNDYCFIEENYNEFPEKQIEKIIVFRWDKVYPQDESFGIDLSKWKLISQNTFAGNSHKAITEEVYVH